MVEISYVEELIQKINLLNRFGLSDINPKYDNLIEYLKKTCLNITNYPQVLFGKRKSRVIGALRDYIEQLKSSDLDKTSNILVERAETVNQQLKDIYKQAITIDDIPGTVRVYNGETFLVINRADVDFTQYDLASLEVVHFNGFLSEARNLSEGLKLIKDRLLSFAVSDPRNIEQIEQAENAVHEAKRFLSYL